MILHDMMRALHDLPDRITWVVFLCPTPALAVSYGRMLGVLLPHEARFSGRTAQLGDKMVSIAAVSDEVFVPKGTPFALGLLGWGTSTVEAAAWQSRSSGWVRT